MLMRAAAKEYGWNLNYGGIALMWRGGCIIRSRFLGKIKEAFDGNSKLTNLLLDDYFRGEIKKCQKGWRNVVATAPKRASPSPPLALPSPFTTNIAPPSCRPTSSRRNAIISALILSSVWTNRVASSSTPIGPGAAVKSPRDLQRLD
jgi:hypothetical protein